MNSIGATASNPGRAPASLELRSAAQPADPKSPETLRGDSYESPAAAAATERKWGTISAMTGVSIALCGAIAALAIPDAAQTIAVGIVPALQAANLAGYKFATMRS